MESRDLGTYLGPSMQFSSILACILMAGAGPGRTSAPTDRQGQWRGGGALPNWFWVWSWGMGLSSLLPDDCPKGSWAPEPEFVLASLRRLA